MLDLSNINHMCFVIIWENKLFNYHNVIFFSVIDDKKAHAAIAIMMCHVS